MAKRKPTKGRAASGAVGGPGTGSGLEYQVDFAIFQALEKISEALVNPLDRGEIAMEPRIMVGQGVRCWDVRTAPPEILTEAKLRPKPAEVIEWLDRTENSVSENQQREFELFYGRGAGVLLAAIERLCRIAREAGGDRQRFQGLLKAEQPTDADVILGHLKTDPHRSLLQIRLVPFEPSRLKQDIGFRLRHLTTETHRKSLYDFLFSAFARGIKERVTFQIRDLIDQAKGRGIEFVTPQKIEPERLDSIVAGALFILQECESGLPSQVIAAGVGCTNEELERSVSAHVGPGMLTRIGDTWAVARFKPPIFQNNGAAIVERALRQLLQFIHDNKKNPTGWNQIPNAIALAKACQSDAPELVASMLWKLNTLLKRAGNKRVVLEVADLSIVAANRAPHSEDQAKGKAVALICGRSWVFQRVNRLEQARVDGISSLKLGEELGWDRNTAYCLKCVGRLYRMEAAQAGRGSDKFNELVRSSIEHLEQAILKFPSVSDHTPAERTAEIGDCYSLLGRTFLVAGDLKRATEAAREAINRITDQTSKDYADLQILLGDLAKVRGDRAGAEACYDDAIRVTGGDDAQKSEIAARAWFQRGVVTSSSHCFNKAAEIWRALDEPENADRAEWESVRLAKRIPESAINVLSNESHSVRLEVLRQYEAQLAGLSGAHHGRRSEPESNYWKSLIPDARKTVAVRHVEWK